jgi:predicted Fe-Mo cluster-binding NifX family protein
MKMEKMRVAYVGRHKLLPAQTQALCELSLEITKVVENLPTESQQLNALLNELKSQGIEAVVTIALPPHLLAALSSKFKVYVFEMKSSTVSSIVEAERFVAEAPEKRTYLPGRPGEPVRILEFTAVNEVKVVIESKRVWPK